MKIKLPDELIFLQNSKMPQHKSHIGMKDKICVIAGSTSGVGLEALKQLAANGAKCVMVCRNPQKAQAIKEELDKLYQTDIDIIIADFSSLNDVRQAGKLVSDKYPVIDVLINSAGLHCTRKQLTLDSNEMVFAVNHLASFLFTQLLLNSLKSSNQGRIIQVNSQGHRFGGLNINDLNWKKRPYIGLRAYGASKTAQLMTVWEMADELKETNVTINAMHPGAVKTNIGSNNGWLYKFYLRNVTWHFLKDPIIAGDALYWLASDESLEKISGKFFNLTIKEPPARHAIDRDIGRKIYQISKELTGLL